MSDRNLEMPWGGILKRTVQAAVLAAIVTAASLAAGCALELSRLQRERVESQRFANRWTDKNRWPS